MNPQALTRLLEKARAGDPDAAENVLDVVYEELRSLAGGIFERERHGHTLQPTALVHEAWLRFSPHLDAVNDRVHFFAIAARTMRRVLIDHDRRLKRQKRGGSNHRVTLDAHTAATQPSEVDIIDLNDSIERLSTLNPRHAQVAELRLFGGLSISETATVLDVSTTTIETDWFTVKSWLRTELSSAS